MTRKRILPLSVGLWLLAIASAGCPPRETLIEISPGGAATLLNACGTSPLDVTTLCDGLTETCAQAGAELGQACQEAEDECRKLEQQQRDASCRVEGLSRPPNVLAKAPMATRLALVTVGDGAPQIRDTSDCAPVDFDCEGPTLNPLCGSAGLNDAITRSISEDGLGFDGLEEAEDTIPVLLMYFDADGNGEASCASDELFACGALDQRIPGEDNYDLVCASCQFGPAATVESAPCFSKCFLNLCAELAAAIE